MGFADGVDGDPVWVLGEWIAQPIIVSLMLVGFQTQELADPEHPSMFAVGPFTLFRRSEYDKVGGHRSSRSEIVEDVELARLIQGAGLNFRFAYFPDFGTLRMYQSFAGLWEGWTKTGISDRAAMSKRQ